jgi:hypothetical protein
MMPQANLFVAAAVQTEREPELRQLLASMNAAPGRVDVNNSLVPFAQFDGLHFARFVILRDHTVGDIESAYGVPAEDYPPMLAFIADFDGDADAFRQELAGKAGRGLERIFSCCEGFTPGTDLALWMKNAEQPAAAAYVNWVGRTLRQIREEEALRLALELHIQNNQSQFNHSGARQGHALLKSYVKSQMRAGHIRLSDEAPTPLGWRLRQLCHFVAVPLVLVMLAPILLIYSPFFLVQLRRREKGDPEIAPRPGCGRETELSRLEDHDVTNQFSAMGSIKPGAFRRWTLLFFLWLVNYTARYIYTRGHLARVSTIHFARWVFINQKKRMLFASNYDGSLDSYMDDLINKVGWGLNLVFGNGIGYPKTNWLVLDGSKDEQKFKYFLRRHQLPTEVWYSAHPGLTAFDLKRNSLIRKGILRDDMSDAELQQWVALF